MNIARTYDNKQLKPVTIAGIDSNFERKPLLTF